MCLSLENTGLSVSREATPQELQEVGVGPIAPSFPPAARPNAWQSSPWGTAVGVSVFVAFLGHVAGCGLSWRSVVKPGPMTNHTPQRPPLHHNQASLQGGPELP